MDGRVIARNKKASYEYFIEEKIECGIMLTGTEIKSIRMSFGSPCHFEGSYIDVTNNEVYIIGMSISKYDNGTYANHEEGRNRKLLLHKNEIAKLKQWKQEVGHTIVPLEIYFKDNRVKVQIGLVRGKKLYDKRETIKKRDIEREKSQFLKQNIK